MFDITTQVLSLIGGLTAIVYWVDRYRNRRKLLCWAVTCERRDLQNWMFVTFELEVSGLEPESLRPDVYLEAVDEKQNLVEVKLIAVDSDRLLQPRQTRALTVKARMDTSVSLHFPTFTFKTNTGLKGSFSAESVIYGRLDACTGSYIASAREAAKKRKKYLRKGAEALPDPQPFTHEDDSSKMS